MHEPTTDTDNRIDASETTEYDDPPLEGGLTAYEELGMNLFVASLGGFIGGAVMMAGLYMPPVLEGIPSALLGGLGIVLLIAPPIALRAHWCEEYPDLAARMRNSDQTE